MSEREPPAGGRKPPQDADPSMRRGVSRRAFITDEFGRAGARMARQLPGLAPLFGSVLRETEAQRDERLVENLWLLLMGRAPKPEESRAGMEVVRNAKTADEKGDGLVDILWALCRTTDFEEQNRPAGVLVRGIYRIALDRDPTDEEKRAALEVIAEAEQHARQACENGDDSMAGITPDQAALSARAGALEGLFTGLLRSHDSVLRRG